MFVRHEHKLSRTLALAAMVLASLVGFSTLRGAISRSTPVEASTLEGLKSTRLWIGRLETPLREHRSPNSAYHAIADIEDLGGQGGMGLSVHVECWRGASVAPTFTPAESGVSLRILVFAPDDPGRQGPPIAGWESPPSPLSTGLFEERVPVWIPLPSTPNPYHATIELVSARPILHQPIDRSGLEFVPKGYTGHSFKYLVP